MNNHHKNTTKSQPESLKNASNIKINHVAYKKEGQFGNPGTTKKKTIHSTFHKIPHEMFHFTLFFFDDIGLEKILDVKNSKVHNMVYSHLQLFLNSTPVNTLDLRQRNNTLEYAKIRISNRKRIIVQLVFENSCTPSFLSVRERTKMIEASTRCEGLEVIEMDANTGTLENAPFQLTVNQISKR